MQTSRELTLQFMYNDVYLLEHGFGSYVVWILCYLWPKIQKNNVKIKQWVSHCYNLIEKQKIMN